MAEEERKDRQPLSTAGMILKLLELRERNQTESTGEDPAAPKPGRSEEAHEWVNLITGLILHPDDSDKK